MRAEEEKNLLIAGFFGRPRQYKNTERNDPNLLILQKGAQ